jgi:1-acyl-sn-glycerol-3-phosphate acyltransferase
MPWLRRLVRLPAMIAVLLLGLSILVFLFPRWQLAQRKAMIRRWANWVMTIVGVRVTRSSATGATLDSIDRPFLLVANHISWLDIFVVDSVRAVSFVAKADIARWPVIGPLCVRAGTIFVERGRRHAVREVLAVMGQELAMGQCVGVFPEGTTGDMRSLLPFHANLLQAAINQKSLIVPVAINYVGDNNDPDPTVLFTDGTSFAESVIRVLGAKQIDVQLIVCEPIACTAEVTRHVAAQYCFDRINLALGRPVPPPVIDGARANAPH